MYIKELENNFALVIMISKIFEIHTIFGKDYNDIFVSLQKFLKCFYFIYSFYILQIQFGFNRQELKN